MPQEHQIALLKRSSSIEKAEAEPILLSTWLAQLPPNIVTEILFLLPPRYYSLFKKRPAIKIPSKEFYKNEINKKEKNIFKNSKNIDLIDVFFSLQLGDLNRIREILKNIDGLFGSFMQSNFKKIERTENALQMLFMHGHQRILDEIYRVAIQRFANSEKKISITMDSIWNNKEEFTEHELQINWAVFCNQIQAVKEIWNPDLNIIINKTEPLLLSKLASANYKDMIVKLFELGVVFSNNDLRLALISTIENGEMDLVKFLLSKNLNPDSETLIRAVQKGNLPIVKELIKVNPD